MQWEGLRHLAVFEKEKESVIFVLIFLFLCHFFSSLTCEKKFMILPIKTNAARPVSAVHITVLLKKEKKYLLRSSAKAMLNDSNCWQCTVMEAFTALTSNSSITTKPGFQKVPAKWDRLKKRKQKQKDSFAFNKWYLHSVKT